jgi:hypothetical protein
VACLLSLADCAVPMAAKTGQNFATTTNVNMRLEDCSWSHQLVTNLTSGEEKEERVRGIIAAATRLCVKSVYKIGFIY